MADVNYQAVHQLWRSESGGYAERRQIAFGKPITAATVAGLTIGTIGLI